MGLSKEDIGDQRKAADDCSRSMGFHKSGRLAGESPKTTEQSRDIDKDFNGVPLLQLPESKEVARRLGADSPSNIPASPLGAQPTCVFPAGNVAMLMADCRPQELVESHGPDNAGSPIWPPEGCRAVGRVRPPDIDTDSNGSALGRSANRVRGPRQAAQDSVGAALARLEEGQEQLRRRMDELMWSSVQSGQFAPSPGPLSGPQLEARIAMLASELEMALRLRSRAGSRPATSEHHRQDTKAEKLVSPCMVCVQNTDIAQWIT